MDVERVFTRRRPVGERTVPAVGTRRLAAVVSVIGFPLALWLIDGADLRPWIESTGGVVLYGVTLLTVVICWLSSPYVVNEFRRRLALAPDHQLDERELALRNESYVVAYRVSHLLLVVAAVAAVALFSVAGIDAISRGGFTATLASFAMVASILPGAVVAWRDRDRDDPIDDAYRGGPG